MKISVILANGVLILANGVLKQTVEETWKKFFLMIYLHQKICFHLYANALKTCYKHGPLLGPGGGCKTSWI